jgi:hypothetical protein
MVQIGKTQFKKISFSDKVYMGSISCRTFHFLKIGPVICSFFDVRAVEILSQYSFTASSNISKNQKLKMFFREKI